MDRLVDGWEMRTGRKEGSGLDWKLRHLNSEIVILRDQRSSI